MATTVAVVSTEEGQEKALRRALDLIGGLADLNTPERPVAIKVGIFDPRARHHTSLPALQAIVSAFDRAPRIYVVESDNYCGKALERLENFKEVFSERVVPFSLSDDPQARPLEIAGEVMAISPALCKPNVLVSTHVLRSFTRGSVLKNLFGCTPMVSKSRFHKAEVFNRLLADLFQACGGVDLAVMDGASLFHSASSKKVPMGLLIVGRDAVAVEAVGATLAGLKPEKMEFLQEFARRGLGEADPSRIEIVGVSTAEFARLRQVHRQLRKILAEEPRRPGISRTIDRLAEEGWLDEWRGVADVVAALQQRGVANAATATVRTSLERRLGKSLEKIRRGGEWAYRRKVG